MDRFIDKLYRNSLALLELSYVSLESSDLHTETINKLKESLIKDAGKGFKSTLNIIETEISKLTLVEEKKAFYIGLRFGTVIANDIFSKESEDKLNG